MSGKFDAHQYPVFKLTVPANITEVTTVRKLIENRFFFLIEGKESRNVYTYIIDQLHLENQ